MKLTPPAPVSAVDGNIRIPVSQVQDGRLHRFILQGTPIRFLVMKTEDGIQTAFDACEICGSQGYIEDGPSVVCLNCAADINTATLGQGGGCNPVKLNARVEGDAVMIRFEDVKKEGARF